MNNIATKKKLTHIACAVIIVIVGIMLSWKILSNKTKCPNPENNAIEIAKNENEANVVAEYKDAKATDRMVIGPIGEAKLEQNFDCEPKPLAQNIQEVDVAGNKIYFDNDSAFVGGSSREDSTNNLNSSTIPMQHAKKCTVEAKNGVVIDAMENKIGQLKDASNIIERNDKYTSCDNMGLKYERTEDALEILINGDQITNDVDTEHVFATPTIIPATLTINEHSTVIDKFGQSSDEPVIDYISLVDSVIAEMEQKFAQSANTSEDSTDVNNNAAFEVEKIDAQLEIAPYSKSKDKKSNETADIDQNLDQPDHSQELLVENNNSAVNEETEQELPLTENDAERLIIENDTITGLDINQNNPLRSEVMQDGLDETDNNILNSEKNHEAEAKDCNNNNNLPLEALDEGQMPVNKNNLKAGAKKTGKNKPITTVIKDETMKGILFVAGEFMKSLF